MERQARHVILLTNEKKELETWLPPFEEMPDVIVVNDVPFVWDEEWGKYYQVNQVFPVAAQYVAERKAPDLVVLNPAIYAKPEDVFAPPPVKDELKVCGDCDTPEDAFGVCSDVCVNINAV